MAADISENNISKLGWIKSKVSARLNTSHRLHVQLNTVCKTVCAYCLVCVHGMHPLITSHTDICCTSSSSNLQSHGEMKCMTIYYLIYSLQLKWLFKSAYWELTHAGAPLLFIIEIRLPCRRWVRSAEVVDQINFSLTLCLTISLSSPGWVCGSPWI